MDLTLIISVATVIATNLITIITLYIHLDNKTDNRLGKIQESIDKMNQMMSDFHSRLEKQDAEFKGKFLLLEQKITK